MNQSAADNSHPITGIQSRQEIGALYTPLDEAVAELHLRRSDSRLFALMCEYHRKLPPLFIPTVPVGAVVRYFVTTAYLRRGRFNGLSPRDWRILLASLVVSNAAWALVCFGGIEVVRRLW